MTNKELGQIGEELACNYLMKEGYRLLHRNWRLNGGCEIDIVAFKDNSLHFVEVKTRTSDFTSPLQAVNMEKIRHVSRAAFTYKRYFGYTYDTRIDAIGIVYRTYSDYELKFIPDVHLNLSDYGYGRRKYK